MEGGGGPPHRHGDHTVLQAHPSSPAVTRVCKASAAEKCCQYAGCVKKVKRPGFMSFLSFSLILCLLSFFSPSFLFEKCLPAVLHFRYRQESPHLVWDTARAE